MNKNPIKQNECAVLPKYFYLLDVINLGKFHPHYDNITPVLWP